MGSEHFELRDTLRPAEVVSPGTPCPGGGTGGNEEEQDLASKLRLWDLAVL